MEPDETLLVQSGKPFGVYGITLPRTQSTATQPEAPDALASTIDLLGSAAFVFFRDTPSLALARTLGCDAQERRSYLELVIAAGL